MQKNVSSLDAQFAGSSSVPAHVEMMSVIIKKKYIVRKTWCLIKTSIKSFFIR